MKTILIILFFIEIIGRILQIGEKREILTPENVAGNVLLNLILVIGIIYFF